MRPTLTNDLGPTEMIIADGGGLKTFYQVAAILNDTLKIKFRHKEDEFDSINWEFKFQGQYLTLHYNIYNGIIVFPTRVSTASVKDQKAMSEIVAKVDRQLAIIHPLKVVA